MSEGVSPTGGELCFVGCSVMCTDVGTLGKSSVDHHVAPHSIPLNPDPYPLHVRYATGLRPRTLERPVVKRIVVGFD